MHGELRYAVEVRPYARMLAGIRPEPHLVPELPLPGKYLGMLLLDQLRVAKRPLPSHCYLYEDIGGQVVIGDLAAAAVAHLRHFRVEAVRGKPLGDPLRRRPHRVKSRLVEFLAVLAEALGLPVLRHAVDDAVFQVDAVWPRLDWDSAV